ncbi:MAG: YfiR/HmsC family protein [Bacteroidales bacterium]|nr:YfiR/HmsC family protein [Bacteroidales bacterium]
MGKKLYILSKRIALILVFVAVVLATQTAKAQISQEALRAHWILTLSEYVEWPGDIPPNEYSIGVYGTLAPEFNELINMRSNRRIKGKPFSVQQFKRVRDLQPTHILFVNSNYNSDLVAISNKLKADSTLIIVCDTTKDKGLQKTFMINLLLKGRGNQFQVNSSKAASVGIDISDKVLAQGGTKIDLLNLVETKDKELQERENMLMLQELQLQQKEKDLMSQLSQNDLEQENILMTKYELENKEMEIDEQKALADSLVQNAENLKDQLFKNNIRLKQQEREIREKQDQLDQSSRELANQQNRIAEREKQIEEHEKKLSEQSGQIDTQQRVILFASIFAGIIVILVILALISSLSRKKKNRQLAQLNDEVDRQKDHILAQAEQLKQINKELEKLSIVASQTDNGVVIMDDIGNVEWVNKGFTNMYGYSINDLKVKSTDSLTGFYASNPDIMAIKDDCLNTSGSRVFECEIVTKQGNNIWVQSTLTPILDENNNISRLVTIDTDITQIKEQERAITKQGETLALQRDELAQQNEFISEQNAHISTSLTYAKTIQDIVMPLEVNITKYFRYFGLFIPLQIVSGDFYWFTRVPDDERLAFTAAVDCTGHGVPGAFMCMISTRLLSEIIVEHKIYDTAKILEHLNTGLVAALKQEETDNNDSLEICICRFCRTGATDYEMSFSGAKRPLYIYHEATKELSILKGDRKTIGGLLSRRNTLSFTSEILPLHSGDKIYMTTDGLINQFDSNNKKYGSDRFVALLKDICPKELPEQKAIIEKEYETYRGTAEQNDDITVFAVQLI